MNLKVNNCGECPFKQESDGFGVYCNHPDNEDKGEEMYYYRDEVIHHSCPEGGAFKIKTSPITNKNI